ncbi:MAG: DUF1853 family protein [Neisseria sp.]|nr:DUF1853 family protein [Neisseria sp.]
MNYALDALWWRLTDPDVRALATLLTAPAPWHSGCEMPVRALLGEQGFRHLLALNDQPRALKHHLAAEGGFGGRLGVYAESLLAFWLADAPHCRLLARNLPVSDGARTLGALDFVAEIGGRLQHIELACKYYGTADGRAQSLAGLNPEDTWLHKAEKLRLQTALAQHREGRRALEAAGLNPTATAASTVLRGILFAAEAEALPPPLNPHAWRGVFYNAPPPAPPFKDTDGLRYCLLPRLACLAPARVRREETTDWEGIRETKRGQAAAVALRPDGFWHEVGRIMFRIEG